MKKRATLALALTAIALTGCGGGGSGEVSVQSLGKIFYHVAGAGPSAIYSMNYDGTEVTQITTNGTNDESLDAFPNASGNKILFQRINPIYRIYSANADGSNQQSLSPTNFDDVILDYDRKTDQILLQSNRTLYPEYYLMNSKGENLTQITYGSLSKTETDLEPIGNRVLMMIRENDWDIYIVNPDGTGFTNLTNDSLYDGFPAWRPDGQKIAWEHENDIWIMDPDGTNRIQITNATELDSQPSWNPDGTKIVFERIGTGTGRDVWIVNADGTGLLNLSAETGNEFEPKFTPDGSKIIFTLVNGTDRDIVIMNPDGTGKMTIADNPNQSLRPRAF